MSASKRKAIFIELNEPNSSRVQEFDISIPCDVDSDKSDVQLVIAALKAKKPKLSSLLIPENLVFKIDSENFPGKLVDLGENSPVKDKSLLRCFVYPPELPVTFYAAPSFASNATPLSNNTTEGADQVEVYVVNNLQVSDGDLFTSSSYKTAATCSAPLTSSNTASSPVASSSTSSSLPSSSSTRNKVGQEKGDAETQIELECPASTQGLELFPTASRPGSSKPSTSTRQNENGRANQRGLDRKKYRLPNPFSFALNEKLERNKPLVFDDHSELVRQLAESIAMFTYYPNSSDLDFVATKLYEKFPAARIDVNDGDTSLLFLVEKLQLRMSRLRKKNGLQYNNKGGRPKKEKELGDRIGSLTSNQVNNEVDMESYNLHVEKLLEMCKEGTSSAALHVLWRDTFPGRRYEIKNTLGAASVSYIVKSKCPLLNQPSYLCKEMDLICGENTCQNFREKWLSWAPKVVDYALGLPKSKKNPWTVLGHYNGQLDDFESKSSAALELLPLLMQCKKKTLDASKYIFDVREETASIAECIKKPLRSNPYVMKIGQESYNIIVDNEPFMYLTSTSIEAFLCLIAIYYVFDIEWSKEILPALLFVQSELLGKSNKDTLGNNSLKVFLNLFRD